MNRRDFRLMCEIQPATEPDLRHVRRQIAALDGVANSFLVPDNHLARATVSSIAVAHEVAALGGHPVACLNSRDRNRLGFRRDLLTAAAYGVRDFLFVRGDDPQIGTRSTDLTVRRMLEETREFDAGFRVGLTTRVGADIPRWKQTADFILVQVSFDLDRLLRWNDGLDCAVPLYAGVLVLGSAAMARRLAAATAEIAVDEGLLSRLESHPDAGVEHAVDLVDQIRATGRFAGVHLVPARRYQQCADLLRARMHR